MKDDWKALADELDTCDDRDIAAATLLARKIIEADERGGHWLAEANQAAERGQYEKAEKLYDKSQFWLDRSNKLRGNS